MSNIVVHEQIDQFGQIVPVLDQQQEGHLCVDQLSGDSVEVDLDGVLLVSVALGADGLGRRRGTL